MVVNILTWLVPIMIGWAMLSILYWRFARRVFHDAILFRIYRKRDQLRNLAIEGKVDPDTFEYEFLEHRLCQTAYISPKITIINFVRFSRRDEAKQPSPELIKFFKVDSDSLKELWRSAIDDFIFMMLANSPLITVFFGFPIFLILAIRIVLKEKLLKSVNNFFEEVRENRPKSKVVLT